ncbi:MAG: extracellular solute-binding protein [Candidatus Methylacidiphilales bacterium]
MKSDELSFFDKLNRWYQERGETVMNMIGFSLLGICFAIATYRIIVRTGATADPNLITIRMSHWQLEAGVRDGLDRVARDYEKICADRGQKVKVEQIPVPEQVYANWFITQLVGGTAPDLVEIREGGTDERLARYFQPYSNYLQEPNPYNKGTDLEGVPWRNTFLDGLTSAYKPELLDYYTIPFTVLTTRVFYNKPMYKQIVGDRPTPNTYEEFMQLCEDVTAYAKKTNQPGLLPMAGSKYNGPMVMNRLFGSQTQKFTQRNNRGLYWTNAPEENIMAFLRKDWSMETPDIISGLDLMQSIIKYMQPGFIQLQRDDATLNFVQKHSLMIASGAWDRTSIEQESPFEVGVFRIPLPMPSNPTYGKYVMGQVAEGGSTAVGFGLNRASPNMDMAVDFYRYLTSRKGSEVFSEYSGWLPSIIGAKIPAKLEAFRPDMDGYPGGTELLQGSESRRIWDSSFYLLARTPDTTVPFRNEITPQLREAFIADMALTARARTRAITRMDSPLGAYWLRVAKAGLNTKPAIATTANTPVLADLKAVAVAEISPASTTQVLTLEEIDRGVSNMGRRPNNMSDDPRYHWEIVRGFDQAPTSANQLPERLRSIIIPEIEFKQATIREVAKKLNDLTRQYDPEGKGVAFAVRPEAERESRPVTLKMTNTPVTQILRYATQLAGVKFRVEEIGVFIVSASADDTVLRRRSFHVTQETMDAMLPKSDNSTAEHGKGGKGSPDYSFDSIKAALTAKGIQFPSGASAAYFPEHKILQVVNSSDQLDFMEALFESLGSNATSLNVAASVPAPPEDDPNYKKLGELIESQNAQESLWYRYRREMADVKP